MKDNSGFTNWETERMYNLALRKIVKLPYSYENFVQSCRLYEEEIAREGRKHFLLYLPDPINYWEVYGRVCSRIIQYMLRKQSLEIPPMKELTG